MVEGLVVIGILAVAYVLIKRAKDKKKGSGTGTPGTGAGGGTRPDGTDTQQVQ